MAKAAALPGFARALPARFANSLLPPAGSA